MISYEEISERIDKLGNGQIVKSGMPTLTELEEYRKSGKDKKNALKYERAYTKLLDKVKNKPHDEKVQFLIDHMSELRTIVDIFSYARDMSMFPHTYFSLTEVKAACKGVGSRERQRKRKGVVIAHTF